MRDRGVMPTTHHEVYRLRSEPAALLAPLDHRLTIDAEDDALEQLAEWAERKLGPDWQPIYADLRLVGVTGHWRGPRVEVRGS